MKKYLKLLVMFSFILVSGFMYGCKKNTDDTQLSKKEEIYRLALDSGYEGTYEEWLASIKGKDGATWLYGDSEPSSNLGKNGDIYFNMTSKTIFVKENNTWINKISYQDKKFDFKEAIKSYVMVYDDYNESFVSGGFIHSEDRNSIYVVVVARSLYDIDGYKIDYKIKFLESDALFTASEIFVDINQNIAVLEVNKTEIENKKIAYKVANISTEVEENQKLYLINGEKNVCDYSFVSGVYDNAYTYANNTKEEVGTLFFNEDNKLVGVNFLNEEGYALNMSSVMKIANYIIKNKSSYAFFEYDKSIEKIDYNALINKMNNNEDFIVLFIKSTCPYCKYHSFSINKLMSEINKKIYYIVVDDSSLITNEQIGEINKLLENIPTERGMKDSNGKVTSFAVPTSVWVSEGKFMDGMTGGIMPYNEEGYKTYKSILTGEINLEKINFNMFMDKLSSGNEFILSLVTDEREYFVSYKEMMKHVAFETKKEVYILNLSLLDNNELNFISELVKDIPIERGFKNSEGEITLSVPATIYVNHFNFKDGVKGNIEQGNVEQYITFKNIVTGQYLR